MKFRLIDTGYSTPSMNMAIDEALLASKLPVIRFYRWKPAGLSIGYFQSIKDFNLKEIKKQKVGLVRRLTGGNAVLHDKELTYSFIISEEHMPKSIIESYKKISNGLMHGLRNLGLKAVMNKDVKKSRKSAVCFNDPSWYEILIDKKKIVGSAQKRVDRKLLQHGAVLIDIDVDKYCSLFSNCSKEMVSRVRERMTSINDELKRKKEFFPVSYIEAKEALIKGFEEKLSIDFIEDKLTEQEKERAKKLDKEKYSTQGWNLNL
ncbi:lipoate--protein ligase family protein [Candidatus Woesearchaeota archaeon]|nr:lipoate--protein ligase family protein [Candidatus Woesearchaeota archaeon]